MTSCPLTVRIVIVDDHELVLAGLKRTLSRHFPDAFVAEAKNGRECLRLVTESAWDVVILDMNLPDRNGLDLLHDIRVLAPGLPVLILSGKSEHDFGVPALRAGAFGYLSKSDGLAEVVEAVRKAVAGQKHISGTLAEHLVRELDAGTAGPPHERLSAREFQVLVQLGAGRTVSEIGARMSLSAKTVSTYRSRVLEKMRFATTAELMRYVMEHDLAE